MQRFWNCNQPTLEVLQSIPRQVGNPYVIVGKVHGQPLVNIFKLWDLVRKAADLDDFRHHNIKNSFALIQAQNRTPLLHLGKLLGQKKTATTERCTHVADNPVKGLNAEVGVIIDKMIRQ